MYDVTLIAIGKGTCIREGVKVIGIARPNSIFQRFFKTIFQVFILAVKENATIYHIHDAEMVPFGMVLCILGKQVIYDIHENTGDDILLKPWLRVGLRKFLSGLYGWLLRSSKHFLNLIIVVAHPRFLKKFYVLESDCTIVQNYPDVQALSAFRMDQRSHLPGKELFYIGMIRDMYYEVDKVLEALYLLNQKNLHCHLHLVGYFGAHAVTGFAHLPFWEGIKNQVTFHGFKEVGEAYEISTRCKIGICLKNQPENMLVSHERKWFEYMAVGLPSLFADTPIYNEINSETPVGIPVNLQQPESIANAIQLLLSDSALLDAYAENGIRLTSEQVNWKMESEKLLQLYQRLAP